MELEEASQWPDAAQLEANCRQIISSLSLSTDHGVAAFAADWLTAQGPLPDPVFQENEDSDESAPASMWCLARVIYDFPSFDEASEFEPQPENLSIQTGDLVAVQYTGRRGWWYGRVIMDKDNKVKPHGRAGWFPSSYAEPTELDRNDTDAVPLGLVNAVEPFSEDVTGMTHNAGDSSTGRLLSFQKGEIIAVWEEGNAGWLLGSVVMNEQGTLEPVNPRGWFPASVTVHFPPDLLLHSMVENTPREDFEQIVDNLPLHASLQSTGSSPALRFSRSQSAPAQGSRSVRSPLSIPPISAENTPISFSKHSLSHYTIEESDEQSAQLARIYDDLIDTIHDELDEGKSDVEILQNDELNGSGIAAMDVMALRRAAGRKHESWISIRWWKLTDQVFSANRHRLRTTFRDASQVQAKPIESSKPKPHNWNISNPAKPKSSAERSLPGMETPVFLTLSYVGSISPEAVSRRSEPMVSAWASRKIEDICKATGVESHRLHLVDCVPGVRITIQVDDDFRGEQPPTAPSTSRSLHRVAGNSSSEVADRIRKYSNANPSLSGIQAVAVSGGKGSRRGSQAIHTIRETTGIQLDTIGLYSTADAKVEKQQTPNGLSLKASQSQWWSSPKRTSEEPPSTSPEHVTTGAEDGGEVRILVQVVKAVGLPLRDAMGSMLDCPYVSLTVEEAPGQSGMTVCTPNARRSREMPGLSGDTAEVDAAEWDAEFMLGVPTWRVPRARVAVEVCNWNHTGADALVGEVLDPRLSVQRIVEAGEVDGWFVLVSSDHHAPILSPPPARSPCLLHIKFFRAPDSDFVDVSPARLRSRSPPNNRLVAVATDAQTQTQTRARQEELPPAQFANENRSPPDPVRSSSRGPGASDDSDLQLSVREWVLYPSVRDEGGSTMMQPEHNVDRGEQVSWSEKGVRFSPPRSQAEPESEFNGHVMGHVIGRAAERVAELRSSNEAGRHREREAVVATLREQRREEQGRGGEDRGVEERMRGGSGDLPTRESFLEVLGQARDQIHKILQRSGRQSRQLSPQDSPRLRSLSPPTDRTTSLSPPYWDRERTWGHGDRELSPEANEGGRAAEVVLSVGANGHVEETITDTPLHGGLGFVDSHGFRSGYEWVGGADAEASWLLQHAAPLQHQGSNGSATGTPGRNKPKTKPGEKVLRMRMDVALPAVRKAFPRPWSDAPSRAAPQPPPPFSPPAPARPEVRRRAWDMWVPGQGGDVVGVGADRGYKVEWLVVPRGGRHRGESAPLPLPDFTDSDGRAEWREGVEDGRRRHGGGKGRTRRLEFDGWEGGEGMGGGAGGDAHSKSIMRGLC